MFDPATASDIHFDTTNICQIYNISELQPFYFCNFSNQTPCSYSLSTLNFQGFRLLSLICQTFLWYSYAKSLEVDFLYCQKEFSCNLVVLFVLNLKNKQACKILSILDSLSNELLIKRNGWFELYKV